MTESQLQTPDFGLSFRIVDLTELQAGIPHVTLRGTDGPRHFLPYSVETRRLLGLRL